MSHAMAKCPVKDRFRQLKPDARTPADPLLLTINGVCACLKCQVSISPFPLPDSHPPTTDVIREGLWASR